MLYYVFFAKRLLFEAFSVISYVICFYSPYISSLDIWFFPNILVLLGIHLISTTC